MKVLKNKKRIDPRYHLDDKRENPTQKSNSEVIEDINNTFKGQFSFDSWLNINEIVGPQGPEPKLGRFIDDEEEFPGGSIADMPAEVPESPCGAGKEGELYYVDLGLLGKLEAHNLKGAVDFALHALRNKLEITGMSDEVAAAVQGLSESDDLEEG